MGLLTNIVYRNNPHRIQELKQEISAAVISTNEHNEVVQNFQT
jgi:hypothetical protein